MDVDVCNRRIPTLVQLCQRVASAHVDAITSLGDDLTYELVRPVLQRCSAEQLLRLEDGSPHLQNDTPEIWRDLCYHKYPLAVERYSRSHPDEPTSWKNHFFYLQESEAKRLEEAATKLRNQRLEADGRKKEREVKFTDRVPPPKRARTTSAWSTNVQPKTLFQKTKSEASKIQRTMYNARIIPPMPSNSPNFRVLAKPDATLPLLPASNDPSRVTVNTVTHRRSSSVSSTSRMTPFSASPTTSLHSRPCFPAESVSKTPPTYSLSALGSAKQADPLYSVNSTTLSDLGRLAVPSSGKKDPMAALFVPKHRAYSQRVS